MSTATEALNPALGKRGGKRETAILPASRGGAASVTTNPRDRGQTARLEHYLAVKHQQQYQMALARIAQQYGVTVSGRVTDPAVLFRLHQRAAFAAQSITRTYQRQMAAARAAGRSAADLSHSRAQWKPDQVFNTEMSWSNNAARRDLFANHPHLAAQATVHAEPVDAAEPECADAVAAGSVPYSQIPIDFPAHVGCIHQWQPDDPAPDTILVPDGTPLDDGSTAGGITRTSATASLLMLANWWTAGMEIVHAAGDRSAPDQSSDDGEED